MRKLSRNRGKRISLLRNMAISLLKYGKIKTTLVKAKVLRTVVEPLITRSKENTLANRRILLSKVYNNEEVTNKLLNEYGPMNLSRNGGYTRIYRTRVRSDSSTEVVIEIIDKKE